MQSWLKKFTWKRRDRRHPTIRPLGGLRRTRQLAIERCEERLVLSGTSPSAEASIPVNPQEGGYIYVSSADLMQNVANNFLFDARGSFADSLYAFELDSNTLNFWNSGFSEDIVSDTAVVPRLAIPVLVASPSGSSLLSGFGATDSAPLTTDATDKPDETVVSNPNLGNNPSTREEDNFAAEDDDNASQQFFISPFIDQLPRQNENASEGGALEITAVVNNTQRAYETQLSAVIVSNLDRDGQLPMRVAPQAKSVVVELARAVTFEVTGQQAVNDPTEAKQALHPPLTEPAEITTPITFQSPNTPTDKTMSKVDSEVVSDPALQPNNLVERIDEEYRAAHATTFSQWPVLATAIASYLLIERNSQTDTQSVQTPPRRSRKTPLK